MITKLVSWAKSAWTAAKSAWTAVRGALTTVAEVTPPVVWKPVSALAVLVVGRMSARAVAHSVGNTLRRAEMDDTQANFLERLTDISLISVVAVIALGILGLNINAIAAMLGGVILGIGLSLREQFSSLATGMILAFRQPFRTGDLVEVAGLLGQAENIGIFDTTLRTPNNETVFIPNAQVWGNTIINYSSQPTVRLDLTIPVNHKSDLNTVRAVLERVVAEDERILEEPKPSIIVKEFTSRAVRFGVRPWVNEADSEPVEFDLNERIKLALDEANIEMSFS